ncbi:MAG: proprotein convertase P-domain-containing protein, partial [Phycisphaerales bacterium]|nr:proprotein convertase P-domain-containing protein [Phycisphaerales bacterium]
MKSHQAVVRRTTCFMRRRVGLAPAVFLAMMVAGAGADETKFNQPPTADQENIASNVDWSDMDPNVVVADDFLSDGRPITAVRWWGSNIAALGPLYGSDPCGPNDELGEGILVTVDPQTGEATTIGPFLQAAITEIEWSPDGNTLYATTGDANITICTIDPNTGLANFYATHNFGSLTGMEFNNAEPPQLLATFKPPPPTPPNPTDYVKLVRVNLTPGFTNWDVLGNTEQKNAIGGLAFNADFSTLYGITSGGGGFGDCTGTGGSGGPATKLITLDPGTGAELTNVNVSLPAGVSASSLEFTEDGRLVTAGSNGILYQIDTASGSAAPIGSLVNALKLSGLSLRPNPGAAARSAPPAGESSEEGGGTAVAAVCGNGIVEPPEECDPPDGVVCDALCDLIPFVPKADGWLIGFHEPLPGNPSAPALGLYFCDAADVDRTSVAMSVCDDHTLREYFVNLADCFLVDANADSRGGSVPAETDRFRAEKCQYDISIQAVVGKRFVSGVGGVCTVVSTGNDATGPFWGWHSTSEKRGPRDSLSSAVTNVIGCDWAYDAWSLVSSSCVPPNMNMNMAFELFTDTSLPGQTQSPSYTVNQTITDCVLPIPPNPPDPPLWLRDTRTISGNCGLIFDLNVRVEITHTWVGDLVVTLARDDGNMVTEVGLMSRVDESETNPYCGGPYIDSSNTDGVNVTFDGAAVNSVETGPFPLSGGYRPNAGATGLSGSLYTFRGLERCAEWTLSVHDGNRSEDGRLQGWTLEFLDPPIADCNGNRVQDACDVDSGFSLDLDGNRIPDDCQFTNNRYLSIVPGRLDTIIPPTPGQKTAIRVKLISLQHPDPPNDVTYPAPIFTAFEAATCNEPGETAGCHRWVGPPDVLKEGGTAVGADPTSGFVTAQLQCVPFLMDWSGVDLLQVTGAEIVPSSVYEV